MDEMSVEELIARRNKVNEEIAVWQRKAAVAKADEERIRKEIARCLETLKTEFGCDTFEDAQALLQKLKAEAQSKVEEMERVLDDLCRS